MQVKWGLVEYTQGQYSWTNLDIIYNYARSYDYPYKHHTLVWGSQQPSWLSSLDSAAQRAAVEKWIDTVGKRYPAMTYVDVVNEPLHTPLPVYKNALGGDGSTGWDWVITAFQLARKSCAPGVKLILNEYNVFGSATSTNNFLTIINLLKERGLIDGIGVQGHYFEFRSHVDASSNIYMYDLNTIKANLNKLTATVLPVYITEFDIDEAVDSTQLAQYKIYFPILWNNPGVKGITFWGYIYNDIWSSHPDTYLINERNAERPALTWLRSYITLPFSPVLISPLLYEYDVVQNPFLVWNASDSILSYRVQVSTQKTMGTIYLDTTVTDTMMQLNGLNSNTRYYWRVSATNIYGTSDFSSISNFLTAAFVGVEESESVPHSFSLEQNYPNPFNPSTTIRYDIPKNAYVKMSIYDILGKDVATLVDGVQSANTYRIEWNPSLLGSGVYFYRMQARNQDGSEIFHSVKRLIFMK